MNEFKFAKDIFKCVRQDAQFFADLAQAALDAHLETCQKVHGYFEKLENEYEWFMSTLEESGTTHEAVLFNLRPIEKTECEHEPTIGSIKSELLNVVTCKRCGVRLKAKWEAVK